jgi:hypothetical protein
VINTGYEQMTNSYSGEPVGMAIGGVASSQNFMNSPLFGKGGGRGVEPFDPLANFSRAPDVTPNVYRPSYVPETRTQVETTSQVAPPSNANYLNTVSNWGGAQNLLNTYAPNLAPPQSAPAMAAPAAAQSFYPGGSVDAEHPLRLGMGIVSEDDPDFQHDSPYKIAANRLNKLYKKTHTPQKAMATAPELGAIDMTPAMMKKAAQGGIMGAEPSLGGYAAGGKSRLLKGPGDGMSDDIPATIADKQPARLADGEFVIPADVVSHLGNGSTDAGAKQLHGMMDNVRKARTGRKSQGKQINASKFLRK